MLRSWTCVCVLVWMATACSSEDENKHKGANTHPGAGDTPSGAGTPTRTPAPADAANDAANENLPPRMRCLIEAYPDHLCGGDATHVRWCDGRLMLWDDGREKPTYDTLLDEADLEDQMAQPYRPGRDHQVPIPVDFDPGRIRHTPFFLRMYGESESAVRNTLTYITWLPGSANRRIRVTTVNGVHEKLAAVSREIETLPPALVRAVAESSGPFNWRDIAGTRRKSMHSFAIAFDVGLDHAEYWRWRKPEADGSYAYKNAMPLEIVEIFERHGFIWGGKWYHFDTPHFEYRPELLHPDCVDGGDERSAPSP